MALTPEDVQAISQVVDQRMAKHSEGIAQQLRDQERRRRRFWAWVFWVTVLLTAASCVASYYWLKDKMADLASTAASLEHDLAQSRADLAQMRVEYNRALAHDPQMQKERAEAVSASGYKSDQTQAKFDADLLAKTFALFSRANQTRAHAAEKAKSGDADADEQSLNDLGQTMSQASSLLMQLMLHETDPARQGSAERMAQGEHPAATPIQQPPAQGQQAPIAPRDAPATPAQGAAPKPAASGATTASK